MPGTLFVKTLAGVVVAAAALVGTLVLVTRGPSDGSNVAEIVGQADRRMGERVSVTGRVDEVLSARSFTLTGGSERILVVNVTALPVVDDDLDGAFAGERVRVTGYLRTFLLEEVEARIGDLIDERYQRFRGDPVIVADAIVPG